MSTLALPRRTRNRDQSYAWLNRQKTAPLSTIQAAALDTVSSDWRETLNGVWFTKLEAVEAFFAVHAFFPRAASKDLAEKPLGIWIATQRYQAKLMSSDRTKILDERLPGWNKSRDEAWLERLEEVCAIVTALGRVPQSNEKDPEAKRAAVWLKKYATAPETDPKVLVLNARIPGWNAHTFDNKWRLNMDALEAFVTSRGRFPSQHEKDRDDRRLGTWLHTRRQAGRSLPAQRREELTRRTPGWDWTSDDKWNECLELTVAYFAEHGRFPSEHSPDPAVATSARWVGTQKQATALPLHRSAALDARLPGWRERRDDKWEAMLDFVVLFEAENGCFPSSSSKDDKESRGGMWMQRQRRGTGRTPEREASLDERAPRWRETAEEAWFRKLADYAAFYRANGHRARVNAADQAERTLGVWFSNVNAVELPEARAAALAAADIGDRRSLDQIWLDTVSLVAAFYATHGRFPTGSGTEVGERALGTWLANRRAGKAKITPERREIMAVQLPGWDLTFEDVWELKLQSCVEFVQLHGRLPSSSRSAPDEEQKSAGWMMDQRKPKTSRKPHRVARLDERLPGWRGMKHAPGISPAV